MSFGTPGSHGQLGAPSGATPAQCVRIAQIITGALIAGALTFAGIAIVISGGRFDGEPGILSWVAVGFSALMFVNHLILPDVVARQALARIPVEGLSEQSDDRKFLTLFPVFQVRQMLACALLEGAAFLGAVAYLAEHSAIGLGCTAAMLVLMAIRFPSRASVTFWVENKARELEMSGGQL